MPQISRWISLTAAGAFVFLLGIVPLSANRNTNLASPGREAARKSGRVYRSPGNIHKLIVPKEADGLIDELKTRGARRLADYGSFQVVSIEDDLLAEMEDREGFEADLRDDLNLVLLRSGAVDTSVESSGMPASLRQNPSAGSELQLIQFVGPVKDEWLTGIQSVGEVTIAGYVANNGYIVWADRTAREHLQELRDLSGVIQYASPFHPAYKLHPALATQVTSAVARGASDSSLRTVTIQLVQHPHLAMSLNQIRQLSREIIREPYSVLNFTNVTVRVPLDAIAELASLSDVINIEPWGQAQLMDERQGQIVSGNLNATGSQPSSPGYLSWLSNQGFGPGTFDFAIDISDTGLDRGRSTPGSLHPDFFSAAGSNRIAYMRRIAGGVADANGARDPDGHGTIMASIAAGYNNLTGLISVDPDGYRYGLGISPFSQIGVSKIFDERGKFTSPVPDFTFVQSNAYAGGARISLNAWGIVDQAIMGTYSADAQQFDALVRDAQPMKVGNQEMVVVFASSNLGPAADSITPPATAKNVITVGAAEGVRPTGSDNCDVDNTKADNAMDMFKTSGRGPTDDGRLKPEIVAPGTHIQGVASQDPGFTGAGVCGNPFFPAGQTNYTWISGTSPAAASVAGAAALIRQWFTSHTDSPYNGAAPSPAMTKAYLVNSARYLTGFNANDSLPSNSQGFGALSLSMAFDDAQRLIFDQRKVLQETGDTFVFNGTIIDPTRPFRVSLAWTDAPGSTAGTAFVNDLDLQVTVGGQTFRGNVMKGGLSVPGGAPDTRNNLECVFLPLGTSGPFSIQITASNIAGDGVPGNPDTTDQDFALAVYNGIGGIPGPPTLAIQTTSVNDLAGGNGDGEIDPGECVTDSIMLKNIGPANATGVFAIISSRQSDKVRVTKSVSAYPNIGVNGAEGNVIPFEFCVDSSVQRGTDLQFTLTVISGGVTFNLDFTQPVRSTIATVYNSPDVPIAIPDATANNVGLLNSILFVPDRSRIIDIKVRLSITHPFAADLTAFVISPSGTRVRLFANVGGSGRNFTDTMFDDKSGTTIGSTGSTPPFTGTFRPQGNLSDFAGEVALGLWRLELTDGFNGDVGTLRSWNIIVTSIVLDAKTDVYTSTDVNKKIAEGLPVFPPTTNSILAVAGTYNVLDINVLLNIVHPHIADLQADLIGPNGARVPLFANVGGNGANMSNTIITDGVPTPIAAGTAPFTGLFRAQGSMTGAFVGKPAVGTWRLELRDNSLNGLQGDLKGWKLYLNHR
ncbi:MAG: S8 family serine peptidase [Acidobacteria bacterium]|nr:S8 family serine peptidase [Acidobacteriota bacterium]